MSLQTNVQNVCGIDAHSATDGQTTVISNEWVNVQYKYLVLEAEEPLTLAKAGQFFHLLCPSIGSDQPFFRRPMSTYKVDRTKGTIEFLYKVTGVGTRGLSALHQGDKLSVLGPLGVGFTLDATFKSIVILGRGVGLATLAPLSDMASEQGIHVTAILSARSSAHVMSQERFKQGGADVIQVTDQDGSSDPSNIEAILRALIAQEKADAFFTCGSNRLMLLMQAIAQEHGIAGQVALEAQMACGLGMCYCCVRPFKVNDEIVSKRVCWDGPVFEIKEVTSW